MPWGRPVKFRMPKSCRREGSGRPVWPAGRCMASGPTPPGTPDVPGQGQDHPVSLGDALLAVIAHGAGMNRNRPFADGRGAFVILQRGMDLRQIRLVLAQGLGDLVDHILRDIPGGDQGGLHIEHLDRAALELGIGTGRNDPEPMPYFALISASSVSGIFSSSRHGRSAYPSRGAGSPGRRTDNRSGRP